MKQQSEQVRRIKKMLGPKWRKRIAKEAGCSELTIGRMVNNHDTSHPHWRYVTEILIQRLQNNEIIKLASDEKK